MLQALAARVRYVLDAATLLGELAPKAGLRSTRQEKCQVSVLVAPGVPRARGETRRARGLWSAHIARRDQGCDVSEQNHYDVLRSTMEAVTRDLAFNGTPIEETLAQVTTAAVQLIPAVDAADVLLIDDAAFTSVAPTSEWVPLLDDAQRDAGEGPCRLPRCRGAMRRHA